MRIAFVSDLHGVVGLYRQLRAFCLNTKPDVLLWGGDIFPDGKRPTPHLDQLRFLETYLEPFLIDLREQLPAMPVLTVLGNHDWEATRLRLAQTAARGLIGLLTPDTPVTVGDVSFFGYGHCPMTPFWVKDFERLDRPGDHHAGFTGRCWVTRESGVIEVDPADHFLRKPTILEELEAAPRFAPQRSVWVCHCPPFETFADMMFGPRHVGSRGVRRFLETRGPRVSLHGHIHEAPTLAGTFADLMGPTLVVNPGRTYENLDAVVFEFEDPENTLRHTRFGLWRDY